MISIKPGLFRHPAVVAAGGAALAALVATNVVAFVRGTEAPWLLGAVILADMLVIGVSIFAALWSVAVWGERSEVNEARLAAILQGSDDVIIGKSLDGMIGSWNRGAEQILGYSAAEAIGRHISLIIPEERLAEDDALIANIRSGEPVVHFETKRRAKDGRILDLSLTVSPIRDAAGRVVGVSTVARDITQRKQAEAESERMQGALTGAQARLSAIVDSAMDAVISVDEKQKIVLFNRAAEQVFGVRREAVLGAPLDSLLPVRFRGAHRGHIESFGKTGVTSRRMGDVTTLWALHADGSEFPIEASISQAGEPGSRFFTVILRDITRRRKYEETMVLQQQELRELSARVLEAREEEKTRIARELHDELGQLLTALKMDLAWLRERLPANDPELAARADGMGELLDRTVSSSRRIAADLRPLMLDDLGLADAAQWLVGEFGTRHDIKLEMHAAAELELDALSKGAATALYRALQESLTNIARHSGAKRAWIVLAREDGALHLEIEDDGRGIAAEDFAKSGSLGLRGMRERVAYYGGSLEIARAPRGGTRLLLRMPLGAGDGTA